MKRSLRLIIFLALLAIINLVTILLVSHNQKAGLYRPEADSIVIPIFNTIFLSLITFSLLIILLFVLTSSFVHKWIAKSKVKKSIVGIAAAALYLLCAGIWLLEIGYWFVPNHYLLSGLSLVMLISIAVSMKFDIQKLFSHKPIESDWE